MSPHPYTVCLHRCSADPARMVEFLETMGLAAAVVEASEGPALFVGRSGRVAVQPVTSSTSSPPGTTSLSFAVADVAAAADAVRTPSGATIGLHPDDLPAGWSPVPEHPTAASMAVVAVCDSSDLDRDADFFAGFGFATFDRPDSGWRGLRAGDPAGVIGLRAGTSASVRLGLETSEPLDALAGRLRAAGYRDAEVVEDEAPHVGVTDPDGQPLEIHLTA